MEDAEVEVRVSPLQAEIMVSGKGRFLPAQIEIKIVEKLYRVRPCKVIRRSRWMIRSGGGIKTDDGCEIQKRSEQ